MLLSDRLNQATPLIPFPELVPVFGDPVEMYNIREEAGVGENSKTDTWFDEMMGELMHFLTHTDPGTHDSKVLKWNSYLWDFHGAYDAAKFTAGGFEDWNGTDAEDEDMGSQLARLGYRLPTLAEVLSQYQTYNNWRLMVLKENNTTGMYFDGLVLNMGKVDEGAWRGKRFNLKNGGYLSDDSGNMVTFIMGFPASGPYAIDPESQWGTTLSGEYVSYRDRIKTLRTVGCILRDTATYRTHPVTAGGLQTALGLGLFSELFSGGAALTATRWWGIPGAAWNKHTYMLGDREVEMLKKYGG